MLLNLALLVRPLVALAQQDNDFQFTTNSNSITITGYTGTVAEVTIPGTIHGFPVKRIGNSAFNWNSTLTSVSIPSSVTNIDDSAFTACLNLTSVTMVEGLQAIGVSAFDSCNDLTNITIPSSVRRIKTGAFKSCSSLSSVTIGAGVLWIEEEAFKGCWVMTQLSLPASVLDIGPSAFDGCTGLTSLTIPSGVTNIEAWAFSTCNGLTNVTFDGGPASIGTAAFYSCASLTSLTIPKGVINVGNSAFSGCLNLTNVTIPATVTNLGNYTFNWCPNLRAITVEAANTAYSSLNGMLFDKKQTLLIKCPGGIVGSVTIPKSVTNIADLAFCSPTGPDCGGLTDVYFEGKAPGATAGLFTETTTVHYLPNTTGWTTTFYGISTALWKPRIQDCGPNSGEWSKGLAFNVNWATGMTIVVESCTNLTTPAWFPMQTNQLASDTLFFSDTNSASGAARFYRVRGTGF